MVYHVKEGVTGNKTLTYSHALLRFHIVDTISLIISINTVSTIFDHKNSLFSPFSVHILSYILEYVSIFVPRCFHIYIYKYIYYIFHMFPYFPRCFRICFHRITIYQFSNRRRCVSSCMTSEPMPSASQRRCGTGIARPVAGWG